MRLNPIGLIILLSTLTLVLAFASLALGPYRSLGFIEVFEAIIEGRLPPIIEYRLTRTLAAIVVGAGLASSGLAMQYGLRNPLADPYLLGSSAGSAVGVIVAYYFIKTPSPYTLYAFAVAGGLLAFSIVVMLGWFEGGTPTSLIVSGVSISYSLMGAGLILMYKGMIVQQSFLWLFGTVAYTPRPLLTVTATAVAGGIFGLALLSGKAYTLILGDEVSESLGVNVRRLRIELLTLSSIIVAATVALAGPIGFIGLAAPWMARLSLGARFSTVLVASTLYGAILALASDITVRLIGGNVELPLAAITALYGGPILFYLTRKSRW